MMYTDLFKLCGYENEEIERERPRLDALFEIVKLGPDDFKRAEARVKRYFDVELKGMCKILGVYLKEFTDLVLSKKEGKRIIYGEWPLFPQILMTAMKAIDLKKWYAGNPGGIINVVMGQIFDKLTPILEAGESNGIQPGQAHCGLYQTVIGSIEKGIIPLPELIFSSSWFCDACSTAHQLVHEVYGVPVVYIDGVMDDHWGNWPNPINSQLIKYVAGQIRKSLRVFEEVAGTMITEEMQHAAKRENAKTVFDFMNLCDLMRADPQPLSQADISIIFWILSPIMRRREADEGIKMVVKGVEQRVKEGKGVVPKGAPRVYFPYISAVDPVLVKMIEETGLSIPVLYINWLPPRERIPGPEDIAENIATAFYRKGIFCSAYGHIQYFKEFCQEWKHEGLILAFPQNCRTLCTPVIMAKKEIIKEIGIPVMLLEADAYDNRNWSAEQAKTRIETFAGLLKLRK